MSGHRHVVDAPERASTSERAEAPGGSPEGPSLLMLPWEGARDPMWGLWLLEGTTGVVTTQSVNPAGSQDQADWLYAPTVYPGSDACIEIATVYRDGIFVTPYDFCGSGWQPGVEVDAAFQASYVRDLAYTVKIEQTDAVTNEWTAYLYNHTTSAWDTFHVSADAGNDSGNGWTVFELYTYYNPATTVGHYCDRTASYTFSSSDVQLQIGGVWGDADATNSVQAPLADGPGNPAFGCPDLEFTWNADNHYTITNPPLGCTVEYVPNSWGTGFTVDVTITNTNAYHVNGWSLLWTFAGDQTITNSWNSVYSQVGQDVTISNDAGTTTITAGGTVNFGFQGAYSGVNETPSTFTLDTGYTPSACAVV